MSPRDKESHGVTKGHDEGMHWPDERWIKLYTRDTVNWLTLSFEAQAILLMIFRKLDRDGRLVIGGHGAKGVAVIIGHPTREELVSNALRELLAGGTLRLEGPVLTAPKFREAQMAFASAKARKAKQRELLRVTRDTESRHVTMRHTERDSGASAGLSNFGDDRESDPETVTPRDHGVTPRDAKSHGVTKCHEKSRGVTHRRDETRQDKDRTYVRKEGSAEPEPKQTQRTNGRTNGPTGDHEGGPPETGGGAASVRPFVVEDLDGLITELQGLWRERYPGGEWSPLSPKGRARLEARIAEHGLGRVAPSYRAFLANGGTLAARRQHPLDMFVTPGLFSSHLREPSPAPCPKFCVVCGGEPRWSYIQQFLEHDLCEACEGAWRAWADAENVHNCDSDTFRVWVGHKTARGVAH